MYAFMQGVGRENDIFMSSDYGVTWKGIAANAPRLGGMDGLVDPMTGELHIGSNGSGSRKLAAPY